MESIKLALLTIAGLLFSILTVSASPAMATPGSSLPPGIHARGMTYRPSVRLPETHLPRPIPEHSTFYSDNWSGYADIACGKCAFRYVAATWSLPSVNCANSPDGAYASIWAGLDGLTNPTVEQTGTDAYCSNGVAGYYAWFEMYPLAPVTFSGVNPGDAINASVYYNAQTQQWQLKLSDLTTGSYAEDTATCPAGSTCQNKDSEVIAEAPSLNKILPLADYGTAGFEDITVTSQNGTRGYMIPNKLWHTDIVDMFGDSGTLLASPGRLYGGQAFTDTWHAAQ